MFRITEDPSSGSIVQCLAKNYKNDSIVSFDMDKVGVMAAYCDYLDETRAFCFGGKLRSKTCHVVLAVNLCC